MFENVINEARIAAKAIVGLAIPIITVLIADAVAELGTAATGYWAAAATAIAVWLVPNQAS